MNSIQKKIYDVVVIGGGPSGLMAAGHAASKGSSVVLLEKNKEPGKKLQITGGGRCNLTNATFDTKILLSKYKEAEPFLHSPFSKWSVKDTLDFFHKEGVPTKEEAFGRVFPKSDSALSVFNALIHFVRRYNVKIETNSSVSSLIVSNNKIQYAEMLDGKRVYGKTFILATGGLSHKETGSTGDGFVIAQRLGHTIAHISSSLVPLESKESWIKALQGISLQDVTLQAISNNKPFLKKDGVILFTHFGVSGPTILNMSRTIGEYLALGKVSISIDLFPRKEIQVLDKEVILLLEENKNKKLKNTLSLIISKNIIEVLSTYFGFNFDISCHSFTKDERKRLILLLKSLSFQIDKLLPPEKAIVTRGGVPLTEIDTKTMKSHKVENLYITGDMLDIERPSGGYSLQLCWTTGFVAGVSASLYAQK